jgi:hypothetical protein
MPPTRGSPPPVHFVKLVTMVLSRAIAAASLASVVAASPLQLQNRQYATPACAEVAAAVAAQPATTTPSVDAKLAYDCITSVPLHKDEALHLLEGVVPYFRWQSNTAWLKDPPAEYAEKVQPAIDVWGGLEEIKSKVESEEYENEFEVIINPTVVETLKLIKTVRIRLVHSTPTNPRRPLCVRARCCGHRL